MRQDAASARIASELLAAGDIHGAVVAAVEDLDIDRLHAFIVQLADRLGDVSATTATEPFIEAMIQLRDKARADKRWNDSDAIRDFLLTQGIEINDSASATTWSRR